MFLVNLVLNLESIHKWLIYFIFVSIEAAHVRKEYDDSSTKLSKIEARISSLTRKLKLDFGQYAISQLCREFLSPFS